MKNSDNDLKCHSLVRLYDLDQFNPNSAIYALIILNFILHYFSLICRENYSIDNVEKWGTFNYHSIYICSDEISNTFTINTSTNL